MRAQLTIVGLISLVFASCVEDPGPSALSRTSDPQLEAALIEDGASIAEANCAACHAIGRTGESPNPRSPLFRVLLSRYNGDMLETELAEGMRVAHAPMPQFQFKPEAAAALIAYLRSIQTRQPGQALVEQRCSRCHSVGQSGTSPYPGAQPFRSFGRRWGREQLREALRTGIMVEHGSAEARPPMMKLNDREIELLLDYLDTIATAENPAPAAP